MPPLSGKESKAGLIRGLGGWNNSSMSRRDNHVTGRLATNIPQSLQTTGGGTPNPSLGIGTIRIAMPRTAAGTNRPNTVVRISGEAGDPNATTFRQNPTFTTRIATITAEFIQTVLPANNINTLNTVQIGNAVTAIGPNAFTPASNSLTTMEFNQPTNAQIKNISSGAFSNCSRLTNINLSGCSSLTSIGNSVFSNCTQVSGAVQIPASLKNIGDNCFGNCQSIASINLASASELTSIGSSAFQSCTSISGLIDVPAKVATLQSNCFSGCSNVTEIKFASSTTDLTVESGAFDGVPLISGGTDISNVTTIKRDDQDGADFYQPSDDTLFKVGSSAFSVGNGTDTYIISNAIVQNAITALGGAIDIVTIGAFVIKIETNAFTDLSNSLNQLKFRGDGTLATIATNAFKDCANINNLNLKPLTNLHCIEPGAFSNCGGIQGTIFIPTNVATINTSAFVGCTSVNSVIFASSAQTIIMPTGSNSPFSGLGFTSNGINLTDVSELDRNVTNGRIFLKSLQGVRFINSSQSAEVINNVININSNLVNSAFTTLNSDIAIVDIGTIVSTIDGSAFQAVINSLTELNILQNGSLVAIRGSAFAGCGGLTSIALENANELVTIESSAFEVCSGATGKITIPVSVGTIGDAAFSGCNNLTEISFVSSAQNVSFLSGSPFVGLSFVRNGTALDGLTEIDRNVTNGLVFFKSTEDTQFFNVDRSQQFTTDARVIVDPSLTFIYRTLEVGTGATSIGSNAFASNILLTTLTFRNNGSLVTIGSAAFLSCNNIESINRFYSYKIPGNISNKISIAISDGNLSRSDAQILANDLAGRLSEYLPANVDTVEFNFAVGNIFTGTITKQINDLVNKHNFLLARSGTDKQFDQVYIQANRLSKQLNIPKEEFWETYFNN